MRRFDMPGFGDDQEVRGDNNSPISSMSGDIKVRGDNNSPINSMSGDIKVRGDNKSSIQAMSGDIEIGGGNSGSINAMSGDIKIRGENIADRFKFSIEENRDTGDGNVIINNSNQFGIKLKKKLEKIIKKNKLILPFNFIQNEGYENN